MTPLNSILFILQNCKIKFLLLFHSNIHNCCYCSISFAIETELLEFGPPEGFILAMDMSGIKLSHLTRMPPGEMKGSILYLQEGLPIRNLGFHFINPVPFMDRALSLFKPFLHKYLAERLFVHNDLESIFKVVPAKLFPREYGGESDSISVHHGTIFTYLIF